MTRPETDPEAIDFGAALDRMKAKQDSRDAPSSWEPPDNSAAVLEQIGVPRRAIECILEGVETTPAVEAVRIWATKPKDWCLVLVGPTGVGKSVAAATWLVDWAKGREPHPSLSKRWYAAPELATAGSYGGDIARASSQPLLVIDDLGAEYHDKSGSWQSKLDRVVDARYRDYRKTIITTNLDPKDLVLRYGERVADRLREDVTWCKVTGRSRRG